MRGPSQGILCITCVVHDVQVDTATRISEVVLNIIIYWASIFVDLKKPLFSRFEDNDSNLTLICTLLNNIINFGYQKKSMNIVFNNVETTVEKLI